MPAIIKRNLFTVFSSHQSLLPVTSAVRISRNVVAAILVSWGFFFFFFSLFFFFSVKLSECLRWRLLRFTAVWRESVCSACAISVKPWRLRLLGDVCDSVCVCVCCDPGVCGYVRVLLQEKCGVITSQLFHAFAQCVCVCFARFGRGGGGVHFSPFMLNVIQTTPLARTHTHTHTHSALNGSRHSHTVPTWHRHTPVPCMIW